MKTPLPTLAVAFVLVLQLLPTAAAAQYPKPDSGKMGMDSAHRAGKVGARHAKSHVRPVGLTSAQVHDLQAALAREGCDPGGIDGRIGPQTRRAIACARHAKGIDGNNANELLRALGLGFTVADSMGMGGLMRNAGAPRRRADAARDMGPDRVIGRDSTMMFEAGGARRGRGGRIRERGRDTVPPGRTPR